MERRSIGLIVFKEGCRVCIRTERVVRKGCVRSRLLFNRFADEVIKEVKEKKVWNFMSSKDKEGVYEK